MSVAACAEVVAAGTVADRYRALRVKRVVHETADAVSIVFDVPAALSDMFSDAAGQFVTFRLFIDGVTYYRSYSMSSAPSIDAELQVTVKRVPGGEVSNWLHDTVRAGDVLDVSAPTGVFVLRDTGDDGLPAPSTCEAGHCATCMARVVEGRVEMARNDVLTSDEVGEGWVLTCQALPASPMVRVVYEP